MIGAIIYVLVLKVSLSGGTGGFGVWGIMPRVSELNKSLEAHEISKVKDISYGWGGAGWAVIENLLLGGGGFGASSSSSSEDLTLEFSYGSGFFDIGYIVLHTKFFFLAPSLGLGGSGISIKLIPESGDIPFDSLLENPARISEISISGITVSPSLNIFIPVKKFTGILLRAGYSHSFSSSWKLNGGYRVLSHPDFTPSGFYFNFNFTFGAFKREEE